MQHGNTLNQHQLTPEVTLMNQLSFHAVKSTLSTLKPSFYMMELFYTSNQSPSFLLWLSCNPCTLYKGWKDVLSVVDWILIKCFKLWCNILSQTFLPTNHQLSVHSLSCTYTHIQHIYAQTWLSRKKGLMNQNHIVQLTGQIQMQCRFLQNLYVYTILMSNHFVRIALSVCINSLFHLCHKGTN